MRGGKMNKFNIIIICLSVTLLTACAPSASAVATAVAKTQAAWTPTPTSTFTPTPTSTSTPTQTSTLTPKPTIVPVVLYSDDFSNNLSGWMWSNSGGVVSQYSGGQYVIRRPAGNYMNWSCANRNFSDAVLTVDAILVSGDGTQTGTDVIWRYVDTNNFYALFVYGNGDFVVDKKLNGKWQQLNNWAHSDTINTGQSINKIAVSFSSVYSTIYINDKLLTSMYDTGFSTGDICLGASSGETSAVEVSFDNLVIYTVDSWTPPK
jgi:hypothetical protein